MKDVPVQVKPVKFTQKEVYDFFYVLSGDEQMKRKYRLYWIKPARIDNFSLRDRPFILNNTTGPFNTYLDIAAGSLTHEMVLNDVMPADERLKKTLDNADKILKRIDEIIKTYPDEKFRTLKVDNVTKDMKIYSSIENGDEYLYMRLYLKIHY